MRGMGSKGSGYKSTKSTKKLIHTPVKKMTK